MDLPTYTNIWRIEKRLYKLYDLRLPMPLPLVQIGVFLGVFVPWILMLRLVGVPFESPWHVLYIVPPGVLTWLATRPVIEGKRLTELLISQGRYLSEPRTWCRLTPIREPREVVVVARVWRRADAPAPVAAGGRAAVRSRRGRRRAAAEPAVPEPAAMPVLLPRPATAPAPTPRTEYAARREPAPVPAPDPDPAPAKPWRRTTRDISHEDDVLPIAVIEHTPAAPQLEMPAGSGGHAPASGAPAEARPAAEPPATRPDIPRPPAPVNIRRAAEEIANAPHPPSGRPPEPAPRAPAGRHPQPPAPARPVAPAPGARPEDARQAPRPKEPAAGAPAADPRQAPAPNTPVTRPDIPAAGREPASPPARPAREPVTRAPDARHDAPPAPRTGEATAAPAAPRPDAPAARPEVPAAEHAPAPPAAGPQRPAAGQDGPRGAEEPGDAVAGRMRAGGAPQGPAAGSGGERREQGPEPRFNGEPGDRKVAGRRTSAARDAAVREPRRDVPRPWTPARSPVAESPAAGPPGARPPVTRPDVPMVPGAFGAQGAQRPPEQPAEPPRWEPPRPWSQGPPRPQRPAGNQTWPPPQPAQPAPPASPEPAEPAGSAPVEPAQEQAPPREVRSQPRSPVRPRPLPPPPPPPPSGPAITPPGPEHEVTGGGLRRLIHAVAGGHGEADAEYLQRIQQPFHGTRHIVVLGCTGGAGQTVTALMLGHTFAQHNGEPVVAIDVNPGPGALARRTRSDTNETLTGLITRADQVNSLTAMRRYTSQAKSGLDVIAAGKNPLQALDDRDYALAIRTIDRFYSVTLLDAAAAVVARVLPYADQLVLVAPASADAPRAVAMTYEWLDGHGYEELRSRAVTVINGVSRRSMDDVEQAEAVARGRCRALVRIPWDDHLSMDRAPRNELKSLRTPTRRAYLALAGVVAGGFTVMPERYQERQQEQEATR